MNFRRFKAIARKESLHVLRDWRSLVISLAIPILLILLFGYALNMDLNDVPTIVWDQSNSPASREFISKIDGSVYFDIQNYADSYQQIEQALLTGKQLIAYIIPADFSRRVKLNKKPDVQVLLDGSDANTGRFALNYAFALGVIYGAEISQKPLSHNPLKIELKTRSFYNQDLRSRNGIVPGVIAIVMIIIAAMLTSVTIAREWETGTMEQLVSTPVQHSELILGKIVPYFFIGMLDLCLAVLLGRFLFGVPLRGNAALLFAVSSFFLSGSLFLGLLLSIKLKKQVVANQAALMISYLPTLFLSGFVFSIGNMPKFLQILSAIVPAKYFINILKGIFLKGVGLEVLWLNALILVFYTFIMFFLARKNLKLQMD
jgi:ABC-2 type transport system permease protein